MLIKFRNFIAVALSFPLVALAQDLPQELSMPTDVGKVVITVADCPVEKNNGFGLRAYATEWKDGMNIIHEGCWTKKDDIVYIWFYNENSPLIASYKDYHFKPANPL